MKEILSDKALEKVNMQIATVREKTTRQAKVLAALKQVVDKIDFQEVFKDARILKKIYRIMNNDEKAEVQIDSEEDGGMTELNGVQEEDEETDFEMLSINRRE